MKSPVLWSGLGCYPVKCSEKLSHIELLYNPRVNKVFTSLHSENLHYFGVYTAAMGLHIFEFIRTPSKC